MTVSRREVLSACDYQFVAFEQHPLIERCLAALLSQESTVTAAGFNAASKQYSSAGVL